MARAVLVRLVSSQEAEQDHIHRWVSKIEEGLSQDDESDEEEEEREEAEMEMEELEEAGKETEQRATSEVECDWVKRGWMKWG